MLQDLDQLATRLERLAEHLDTLDAQRNDLARRLARAEAENQRLRALLALARDRVDQVLNRLPNPDPTPEADTPNIAPSSQPPVEPDHGTA